MGNKDGHNILYMMYIDKDIKYNTYMNFEFDLNKVETMSDIMKGGYDYNSEDTYQIFLANKDILCWDLFEFIGFHPLKSYPMFKTNLRKIKVYKLLHENRINNN